LYYNVLEYSVLILVYGIIVYCIIV